MVLLENRDSGPGQRATNISCTTRTISTSSILQYYSTFLASMVVSDTDFGGQTLIERRYKIQDRPRGFRGERR
jgi:hypothetical protein